MEKCWNCPIYLHIRRALKEQQNWCLRLLTVYELESRHKHILAKTLSREVRPSFISKGYYHENFDCLDTFFSSLRTISEASTTVHCLLFPLIVVLINDF